MVLYQAQILNTPSLKTNQNQFHGKQQTPINRMPLLFPGYNNISKKDNLAANGDATGTGCSLSYSTGQTDYLISTSGQGSISLGFQQPFFYSVTRELNFTETIIYNGEALCFNAAETIFVACYRKQFTDQYGGLANSMEVKSIIMKHGIPVEHSGIPHAYISDVFCDLPERLFASFKEHIQPEPEFTQLLKETFFKVYPNPTTGDFTLKLLEFEKSSGLTIDVYNIQAHLILSREFQAEQNNNFSLAGLQPGIYI